MPKAKRSSGSDAPLFPDALLPLLFLIVPVAFFTGTRDPFLIKDTLAQAVLTIVSLAWVARFFTPTSDAAANGVSPLLQKYPLLLPLACYLAAQLISLKNAVHAPLVLQSAAWQALLIGLYAACADAWRRDEASGGRSAVGKIEAALLCASGIAGAYGVMQKFGLDFLRWGLEWAGRPASTFGNPNFAAGWWVLIIPLFAARFRAHPARRPWGAAGVVILAALNLYWGRTVGAWAALLVTGAIALGVKIAEDKKIVKKSVALPLLILLGAGAFGAAFLESARRMPDHQSIQERILKWRTAKRIIADYPVAGVGAGNVKVHFALYQADVSRAMGRSLIGTSESNVHNEFLQVAAESGIIGFAAYLLIFAVWLFRWTKKDAADWHDVGRLGAVLSFLFYSLTNFPYRITPVACLLIFILASGEKSGPSAEKSREPSGEEKISAGAWAAIGLIGAVIFWRWILPPFQADVHRDRAAELQARGNFAEAAKEYEQALKLDFYHSERSAYELGECRRATGDVAGALAAYQESVKLRNYGEVYNNMGNCYYLLGRFSDAKSHWQKAVDLELPDPKARSQTIENIRAIERRAP